MLPPASWEQGKGTSWESVREARQGLIERRARTSRGQSGVHFEEARGVGGDGSSSSRRRIASGLCLGALDRRSRREGRGPRSRQA
jgi:hypothetical protein